MSRRILLLGGVTEALLIARQLGPQHVYSLAGIGRVPSDLACQVRVGGYGGAEGLAAYLRAEGIGFRRADAEDYWAQCSAGPRLGGLVGVPALGIPAFGLIVALYALVIVAGFAQAGGSIKQSLVLATVLAVGSYGAFVYMLKLQFPVWPAFLTA